MEQYNMLGKINGMKVIETTQAVEENGKTPVYVKRGWKKRLFTLPFKPFKKDELIMVPDYKPCMYIANDVIYCHPALKGIFNNL